MAFWTLVPMVQADNSECTYNWDMSNLNRHWASGDLCGIYPGVTPHKQPGRYARRRAPVYNHLQERHAVNPNFVLDTAFMVVDGHADEQWIVNVTQESESWSQKMTDTILGGLTKIPVPAELKWPVKIMAALGLYLNEPEEQPLTVDLTDFANRLKNQIQGTVDQTEFNTALGNLKTLYSDVYARKVQEYRQYTNADSAYANLVTLETSMATEKTLFTAQDWPTKYGFFLVGPMVAHASLHFTVTSLRAAASMQRFNASREVSIIHDMCIHLATELSTTWATSGHGYLGLSNTMLSAGLKSRKDHVPSDFSCKDSCYWSRSSTLMEAATYTWQDKWELLEMPLRSESWNWAQREDAPRIIDLTINGVKTNGAGLRSEISRYVGQMDNALKSYNSTLSSALHSMRDGLSGMLKGCTDMGYISVADVEAVQLAASSGAEVPPIFV